MDIPKNRKILVVIHSIITLLLGGAAFILVVLSQSCGSSPISNMGCSSAFTLAACLPIAGVIAVCSLLKPNKFTRIYLWIYSVVMLASFPIGTAVGSYTMYFLHKGGSNNS